jgi:hypothetical protein
MTSLNIEAYIEISFRYGEQAIRNFYGGVGYPGSNDEFEILSVEAIRAWIPDRWEANWWGGDKLLATYKPVADAYVTRRVLSGLYDGTIIEQFHRQYRG